MAQLSLISSVATLSISALAVLASGCAEPAEQDDPVQVGQQSEAIINGTPDTTHPAVVAVLDYSSACSGTIIHTDGNIGHVISAAHCGGPVQISQGTDYSNPDYVYPVLDYEIHPNYQSAPNFDFMIVRIASVGPGTPVIPAMTAGQDNLNGNTQIRHVGYGKAGPAPGSNNTIRREFTGEIWQLNNLTFNYHTPNGGPCSGDSGGPQLTLGTERVAGVTSTASQGCQGMGTSGRISAVYDSFIMDYINNTPVAPVNCGMCEYYALMGQGACVGALDACLNDTACSALRDCLDECSTVSCKQICFIQHADGLSLYSDINDCICDTACVTECSGESTCESGSSSSSSSSGTGGGAAGGGEPIGGAGGAGTSSSGDPSEGGWTAGNNDGQGGSMVVDSSCTTTTPGRTATHLLWLLALGLATAVGARSRRAR